METKKPRRRRRTKIEIENDIWAALERLISSKNIHNITIIELAQEAQVEPVVLYNRFENLNEAIEKYVRRYDYWLKDTIRVNLRAEAKSELKKILTTLINELYRNEIMQQILLWELNNDSEVCSQMAKAREMQSESLYLYFEKYLSPLGSELRSITSVLIAGIYYLVLHKKISTFGFINFDSEKGKQALINVVEEIIEHLFLSKTATVSHKTPQSVTEVAQNMLDLGIETERITLATGLTVAEIDSLRHDRRAPVPVQQ